MEFPESAATAAAAAAAKSPASPVTPSSPLTDTQLLQLSLNNAVAAAAAGKATVAANNYALVVKIFFRKCFLLEELVLLALAMGYETRKSAATTGKAEGGAAAPYTSGKREGAPGQSMLPSVDVDSAHASDQSISTTSTQSPRADPHHTPADKNKTTTDNNNDHNSNNAISDKEQLVDPLANVGMLLPPGLDEDDYAEERTYYEQKKQREAELAHTHDHAASPTSQSGSSTTSRKPTISAAVEEEDTPGYDAATARWLACLLAKVHPDALPIATLEKLCRVPIPSKSAGVFSSSGPSAGAGGGSSLSASRTGTSAALPQASSFGSPTGSSLTRPSEAPTFPCASSGAPNAGALITVGGGGGMNYNNNNNNNNAVTIFSPNSSNALAHLIPHLKSSPTSSLTGNMATAASPTLSTTTSMGTNNPSHSVFGGRTPTTNLSELTAVFGTSASSSLSLLFATLLWDVACALWNEGFVEDTHHWLSVMDVRRLWKLYGDSCVTSSTALAALRQQQQQLRKDSEHLPGSGGSTYSTSSGTGDAAEYSRGNIGFGGRASSPFAAAAAASSSPASTSLLSTSAEPMEENVFDGERACALSWPAVLAECRAADEPMPRASSKQVTDSSTTTSTQQQQEQQASQQQQITSTTTMKENAAVERSKASAAPRLPASRSGITLSAFSNAPGPLSMTTSPTRSSDAAPTFPTTDTDNAGKRVSERPSTRSPPPPSSEKARDFLSSQVAAAANREAQDGGETCGETPARRDGRARGNGNGGAEEKDAADVGGGLRGVRRDGENEQKGADGFASDDSSTANTPATATMTTAAAAAALQTIPLFVRRLARRTSALRDLCGLMMGCETAEDVFYVMYAFHCALQTQQQKMAQQEQQQQQQPLSEAKGKVPLSMVSGGLAEVLIIANLLVEFFLSKRAQKILLDSGVLPEHMSPVSRHDAAFRTSQASSSSPHQQQRSTTPPHVRSEQTHRMDRAIRQACDEIVCAFTNGQCLTLYGLESYGIPPPHDTGSSSSNGGGSGVQLLAPELPYVLASNVLSSTLNFSTLYRLSKVFQGVMNVRGGGNNSGAKSSGHGGLPQHVHNTTLQCSLAHPNMTRKATDEEKLRRRRWTRVAPPTQPQQQQQQQQQQRRHTQPSNEAAPTTDATISTAQSVVGELFGFMKGAAASWRNVANFVHPMSSDLEAQFDTPTSSSTRSSVRGDASNSGGGGALGGGGHHDVRPSQLHVNDASHGRGGSGGYAERLAEARREQQQQQFQHQHQHGGSELGESTPWSSQSPNTVTCNNSGLDGASGSFARDSSTTETAKRGGSGGDGQTGARKAFAGPEMQTSGPGACELLVPSHPLKIKPSTAYTITSTTSTAAGAATSRGREETSTTAASSGSGATFMTISLLAEENERMSLVVRPAVATAAAGKAGSTTVLSGKPTTSSAYSPTPTPTPTPTAAAAVSQDSTECTVVHTPSIQLQSRTPNEAASLRLLTLLYRYPQLHTLEPVTASHVDLVAKELNKALHILQVAMRTRFGERWWLQWRARREGETQRYYARALADAQRGGRVLGNTNNSSSSRNNNDNHDTSTSVGKMNTNSNNNNILSGAAASATTSADGLPSPVEAVPPPSMVGSTAIQPDPSLVLKPAPASDSLLLQQQQQQFQQQQQQQRQFSELPQAPPSFILQDGSDRVSSSVSTQQQQQPHRHEERISAAVMDFTPVPPPAAPQPTPRQEPVLSKFWNTRTLSIPTDETIRERRQNLRGHSIDPAEELVIEDVSRHADTVEEVEPAIIVATETGVVTADGDVMDVHWDVPPAYTPEVSLDFSAFTTTSVETQEATRQLVEALQRQQKEADAMNANVPGVSLLSPACRRLLHNELPLLQQYSPWRVIYTTRMHGVSLSTLFANCRRESERHQRQANGLFGLPMPTETSSGSNSGANAGGDGRPMLLVLELPASTTFQFAEDDPGVRDALAFTNKPTTVESASRPRGVTAAINNNGSSSSGNGLSTAPVTREEVLYNKLYIGAYLSDLLRLESRRYYGTQECFLFQLLVPADKTDPSTSNTTARDTASTPPPPPPQLRVFHASRQNTQYINCRLSSIVIGGGGGGSSVYLDNTLCHGATSACSTFNSPPLSIWQAAATLGELAGVQQQQQQQQQQQASKGVGETPYVDDGRQHSLYVLNVEVIVVDN